MNTSWLKKTPRTLSLLSFTLTASACVHIPNVTVCTAAGKLVNGAICAETLTGTKSEMTMEQYLDFLEASEHEGRSGAMCISSADYLKLKTAEEQMCKMLGTRCVK